MGAGGGCRFCKTGNKYPIQSRQKHEERLNRRTCCNILCPVTARPERAQKRRGSHTLAHPGYRPWLPSTEISKAASPRQDDMQYISTSIR